MVTDDYLPRIGGVAAHIFHLSRALMEEGVRIKVLSLEALGRPATDVVPYFWHRPLFTKRTAFKSFELSLKLPRMCRRIMTADSLDVLHFHCRGPVGTALRSLNCPKVFTNHTSAFLKNVEQGNLRELWREVGHAQAFLGPSRELCEALKSIGVEESKISYCPNGVDTERFRIREKRACRERWGIPQDKPVLLCARRLVEKNGIIYLLKALEELEIDFHLVVAGNRSLEKQDDYERYVCGRWSDDTRVSLLGQVPHAEMHTLYSAADISLVPSLKEATSLTALESMASGCVVIGSRVGGLPEVIEHGVSGYLCAPAAPEELSRLLTEILSKPQGWAQVGEAARERVAESFSWRRAALDASSCYRHLRLRMGSGQP